MPAVVHARTWIAWNADGPQLEREEHAYRWVRTEPDDAWVGEERAAGAPAVLAPDAVPELVHDLRHQLTRAELELEAGEPAAAQSALARAREACEEALGLRRPRALDLVALCSEEARAAARVHPGREIQTSLPRECAIPCSGPALRRLLANLLGNALRATPAGEAVHFALAREADGGARLSIADQAGGFERDAIDRLLGSRASGSGSTGLGSLAVLECARRLRATILVASTAGAGSEFSVRLPG
jgi:two-component system sensor histidine kinase BaeS